MKLSGLPFDHIEETSRAGQWGRGRDARPPKEVRTVGLAAGALIGSRSPPIGTTTGPVPDGRVRNSRGAGMQPRSISFDGHSVLIGPVDVRSRKWLRATC